MHLKFTFIIAIVVVIGILLPNFTVSGQPSNKSKQPVHSVHEWVKRNFAKGTVPPFSFVYNGKHSSKFISTWRYDLEKEAKSAGMDTYIFSYYERRGGLKVSCHVTVYAAFNAVEWTVYFSNTGGHNSQIIERAKVVDRILDIGHSGTVILHHALGSNASKTDFSPIETGLQPGDKFSMTPSGARGSSDNTAFPFFNVENKDIGGVLIAVGWTGKWFADVEWRTDNSIHLSAGMETMRLSLFPGESIRTPKICLLYWTGDDRMEAHNRFRRFVLAHHSPKINGSVVKLPLAAGLSRGGPEPCNEFTCLTESYAKATIDRFKQFEIVPDVCWIDAGWYEGGIGWWEGVGNWRIDRKRFPNGLKPVSDMAHDAGSKLLLWFEPERVRKGTRFATQHPEWLLDYGGTYKKDDLYNRDTYLFNLGNAEAREWLTDFVVDFMKKEGIDYYRQDFNWVNAKECWERNDKPGRIGISEIRYIEGLYAFWDSLKARIPGILIDNCASGGRRIDLETISRSVPLWRSDYGYGEPDGYQNHTYGLNFYLPLHGTGTFSSKRYDFRSSLSSSLVMFWDIHSAQSSVPEMQRCMKEFRLMQPYYYGDYYPLTSPEKMDSDAIWLAYQLNRPSEGDGKVVAFRRKSCTSDTVSIKLQGLNAHGIYQITNEDSKEIFSKNGQELMSGFNLSLENPLSSLLLTYKIIQ